MPSVLFTLLQSATILGALWIVQAICFALSRQLGQASAWLALGFVVIAAWMAGRRFAKRRLLATAYGAALGWIYMQAEWILLNLLLVRLLGIATENEMQWESAGYSTVVALMVLMCAVSAVVAASYTKT